MSKQYRMIKTHDGYVIMNMHADTPAPIAFFDTKDKAKRHMLSLELKAYIDQRGARHGI